MVSKSTKVRVYFGGARSGHAGGPLVKLKRLKEAFSEFRFSYNLLYVLSNAPYLPEYGYRLISKKGVPIILNQNGVFYRSWYQGDWEKENRQIAVPYHLADYVFFQSEFCKRAATKFLGERQGPYEVLYNAVDTKKYFPKDNDNDVGESPFTFLTTGRIGIHLYYKIESILRGFSHVINEGLYARLIIAGGGDAESKRKLNCLIDSLGMREHVILSGPYTQEEGPEIYRRADAYITTTHQDNCPNAVIEALSCGLPVIYSNTGGVPELVGNEAGVALNCKEDWESPQIPDILDICNSMLEVSKKHKQMSKIARQRALDKFDISHWIKRHEEIFYQYLNN